MYVRCLGAEGKTINFETMENIIVPTNFGNFIVNEYNDVTIYWIGVDKYIECTTQIQYEDFKGNKITYDADFDIYAEQTLWTQVNGLTAIKNSSVTFNRLIRSTRQLQSIVTVPMIQNLCEAPTNLRITLFDFDSELSWSPSNNGSCQITSYTVFWCYHLDENRDCRVSNSFYTSNLYRY